MKNHRTILWVAPLARFCGGEPAGATTIANVNPSPSTKSPPHASGLAQPERSASGIRRLAIPLFNKGKEPVTVDRTTICIPVADKDRNFMLELSSVPNIRNTCSDVSVDALRIAFEGHKTIDKVAERMPATGDFVVDFGRSFPIPNPSSQTQSPGPEG